MDPKATLDHAKQAIADSDWYGARYALKDYWDWRRSGGFQPSGGDKRARSLEVTMAKKRRKRPGTRKDARNLIGLKGTYKSSTAANRRRYSKIAAGSPVTRSVPRACAIVQSGGKKGKIRKGCRMTKSGARCDVLTRLPREARARVGKKFKLVNCPS